MKSTNGDMHRERESERERERERERGRLKLIFEKVLFGSCFSDSPDL